MFMRIFIYLFVKVEKNITVRGFVLDSIFVLFQESSYWTRNECIRIKVNIVSNWIADGKNVKY